MVAVRALYPFTPTATLEACTLATAKGLDVAGVNRIAIGLLAVVEIVALLITTTTP